MSTIQPGYYKARAIAGSAQYGTTNNGNDQIILDVDVPDLGRSLQVFLTFTDASATYSIEKLRRCGWVGDDVRDLSGIDANEIEVSVSFETYQGKERMKVDIANGGGKFTLEKPMDSSSKDRFAARMKSLAKATAAAPGAKPGSTGGDPGDRDAKGDRIPF